MSLYPTVKLGRVARIISGVGFPHPYQGRESGEHPFLKVSDLATHRSGYSVVGAQNWVSRGDISALGGRMAPAGSVVFPKVGAALLKNPRRLLREPSAMDNNLMAVVPQVGDPRFWVYALSIIDLGELAGSSPLPFVNEAQIRDLRVSFPGECEQRHIADFLDAETARIDRLCDLRAQQIELLREASFRRIYDAVRGSHVEGARKDSGLEWLGTVPAAWRVGSVSHYFEVELGKMLNQERAHGDHLRPYLRVANVQWDRIDVSNLSMMDFPPEEQVRYRLRPGDLLVNEGGSWPGRAAVWDGEVPEIYYQKALHRIRSHGAELPRWLYYCIVVAERLKVFQVQGNTSTMTHLTREQLRPQRFPFPDPGIQRELVDQLDRAASRDLEVGQLLESQLALLAERRQALITAAVTGQFDVSTASGRNVTDGVSA